MDNEKNIDKNNGWHRDMTNHFDGSMHVCSAKIKNENTKEIHSIKKINKKKQQGGAREILHSKL